ncbi:MAG: hypothetical protein GKR94_12450 [Gammaproteobacteria bacterium]|nr:hypothetical protein [Gammaproteobacteria bacterium]
MDELARHLSDIDTYHTTRDKPAYNHGMFWHTAHYAQAGLATHRTYPRADGVMGGGPSSEHLYTSGLALHYWMTGSEASYEAVINFGRYVIDADDGSLTPFRFLSRGPTGIVSCSGTMDYHGPGRGPGNAMEALMNAFDLGGERRFLIKAEELLCRCVHPHDDLGARNLLDIEYRWYYMVFLRTLLKYLALKQTLGEIDWHYAYARESLLTYARWAAEHEYPYIDKPEALEFPNETWPAQELRKSDVFELAARYAGGEWRERFRERARFFYAAALDGLSQYPDTRLRARPMVLLSSFGVAHATLRNESLDVDALAVAIDDVPGDTDFGQPLIFVRQKRIAMRRAAFIAVCGCAAFLASIAALVF